MRLTLLLQSSLDISSRARSSARALSLVSDFWAETRPRHPAAADTQSPGKRSGVSVGEMMRLGPPRPTHGARDVALGEQDRCRSWRYPRQFRFHRRATDQSQRDPAYPWENDVPQDRRAAHCLRSHFVIGASQTLRPARPNLIASSSNHSSIFVDSIFRQWLGRRACMLSFRSMMPARGITFGRLRWKEA